jgi:hypothetical protein
MLVLVGKPGYFLEMIMGQFSSRGTIKVFDCVPAMRGKDRYLHQPDKKNESFAFLFRRRNGTNGGNSRNIHLLLLNYGDHSALLLLLLQHGAALE